MDSQFVIRVESDVKNLAEIRRFVRESATALKVDPAVIADVVLAVDEAATNIVLHGYQEQPGIIKIGVERKEDSLVVRLQDQAPPFDPRQVPPPDLTLPLERRPLGNLGVYLMMQLMDSVIHNTPPEGGNQLILVNNCF